MDKKYFSPNGHYTLKDYKYALKKVEKSSENSEIAHALLEYIYDSENNHTSAHQGMILSILRECVELEVYLNKDNEKRLKVASIKIPEDLKDFFPDVASNAKPSERGEE